MSTIIKRAALIAPLIHMPSQVSDAFAALTIRYNWLRKLVGWTLAVPLSIRKREQVLGVVFGPEQAPKDFPIRGGGLLGLRPSHFIAASRDLTSVEEVLPQMQARYDDLKLPIGILYGREDAILDPQEQGQALADRLDNVELTLIEGGHMLPITQPEACLTFIRARLQAFPAAA